MNLQFFAETIDVSMQSPKGVTLATKGKYVPKNIKVTPTLQEKSVTANGVVTPDSGYAGLSKVTVNVEKGITPTGSVTITANGTHDVTNYAKAVVNVPTSGGSSSGGQIIEVTALPTANIDKTAIYLMDGAYYRYGPQFDNIAWADDGNILAISEVLCMAFGIEMCKFLYVETRPTENVSLFDFSDSVCFYYIADENNVFIYVENQDGEFVWVPYDAIGFSYEFAGVVSSTSEITADGAYAIISNGWRRYVNPTEKKTITENGEYDVTSCATAVVKTGVPISGAYWGIPTAFSHYIRHNDIDRIGLDVEVNFIANGVRYVRLRCSFDGTAGETTSYFDAEGNQETVMTGDELGDGTVNFGIEPQYVDPTLAFILNHYATYLGLSTIDYDGTITIS